MFYVEGYSDSGVEDDMIQVDSWQEAIRWARMFSHSWDYVAIREMVAFEVVAEWVKGEEVRS